MNLVGKIFIVLIFVLSLVFMSFVVAVYATHTNWRDVVMRPREEAGPGKPVGLKHQLEDKQQRVQELQDRLDTLTKALEAEKLAAQQAIAKLESDNAELVRQREQLQQEYAALVEANNRAQANLKALQEEVAALRAEVQGGVVNGQQVVGLREEIRQVQKDRDAQFQKVVELTDQLHQAVNQYQALKERNLALAKDLANAQAVLRKFGLKPYPELYEDAPPEVDGVILAVTQSGNVEISIGEDDGLVKGHTLEVYRIGKDVSKYLGRIQVLEVMPDKASCKILPEFQKGPMQRGDRVASRLE